MLKINTNAALKFRLAVKPATKIQAVISEMITVAGYSTDKYFAIRIDNEPYERLCIELIAPGTISVAHYYQQNGDTVPDPDIVFAEFEGKWYPVSYQDVYGLKYSVFYDETGTIIQVLNNMDDITKFTNKWAVTLKQQGFLKALKAKVKEGVKA